MNILVLNAGSSSLKYQLININSEEVLAKGSVERIGSENTFFRYKADKLECETEIEEGSFQNSVDYVFKTLIDQKLGIIKDLNEIDAIGHRIVHGGERFRKPCILDGEVMAELNKNSDIAPLHNPANIMCIEACKKIVPHIPMVGVFDTAFHSTLPRKAYLYAIPIEAYEEYRIRKYGFHGISHDYVAKRAAHLAGRDVCDLKIITCHLGNGSSVAAVNRGEAVDTSMGFSPLEGVMMGTRSGDIDPTAVKYLAEKMDMSFDEAICYLNKKSGVLGVSGLSNDFRDVLFEAENGNTRAELAISMFCYRIKKYIGAYAASMNGADIIAFAGGIGENSAQIRKMILEDMDYLGVILDDDRNNSKEKEKLISDPKGKTSLMVIPTNEELSIARETDKICSLNFK